MLQLSQNSSKVVWIQLDKERQKCKIQVSTLILVVQDSTNALTTFIYLFLLLFNSLVGHKQKTEIRKYVLLQFYHCINILHNSTKLFGTIIRIY